MGSKGASMILPYKKRSRGMKEEGSLRRLFFVCPRMVRGCHMNCDVIALVVMGYGD